MSGGAIVATSLDVIYWRGSAELRSELINGLERDGYKIETVRSLEDVLDRVEKSAPAFIIVDGTAGEGEASKRVVELSSAAKLFEVRVIFISVQASKRAGVLEKQFPNFATVDVPFSVDSVIADINKAVRGDSALKNKEDGETGTGAYESKSIANKLKSAPGRQFAMANKLLFFDDSKLLPDHPNSETIKKMLDELTEKDRWLGLHARRVAYLSSTLASAIKVSKSREENICLVSVLFSESMLDAPAEVRKADLFEEMSDESRRDFMGRIRSASRVAEGALEDALAEKTLSAIAALLENASLSDKMSEKDREIFQDAQCSLASEFADRACWNLDFWNPRGAHKALRKLREGKTLIRDPEIIDALARVLTQALLLDWRLTNVFDVGLSEEVVSDRGREVGKALKVAKELFRGAKSEEIPLFDIEVDMILASPVISNDGTIVVPANLRVDEDILWRIRQLVGVRPLRPTVYVSDSFAQASSASP